MPLLLSPSLPLSHPYGLLFCRGMVEQPPHVVAAGLSVWHFPPLCLLVELVRTLLLVCPSSRRAWFSFCGIRCEVCTCVKLHGTKLFDPVWGSPSTPCGVSWCPLLMPLQRWSVHVMHLYGPHHFLPLCCWPLIPPL